MKAPFPWYGGKRRAANIVWPRFGNVINFVEPFCGSLAVALERPHEPRCETFNDKDCFLANFWRAISNAPDEVAKWADWPVNEADLHARHLWLTNREEFRERMKTDPDFYDVKIAGWWVTGICQWIGGGWCKLPNERRRPQLRGSQGIHRKRVSLKRSGVGVHRQLPDLGGTGGFGRGIHGCGFEANFGLFDYFRALSARLRRARVCCGDWMRVLGPTPTFHIGTTAVFLDPPYSDKAGRDPDIYSEEDLQVAHKVREWAIANGDNPKLRIALCGYEGEHEMPSSWECVAWIANGGYSNANKSEKNQNRLKERIWFSPHCLQPTSERGLFDSVPEIQKA